MPNKYHPFDSRLEHRAVAAIAQTATATVDTITQRVAMRTDYMTHIGIEAIDIVGNDELYTFLFEVTNDSFTTVETAAIRDFGATETRAGGAPDSAAGDHIEVFWSTEVGDTVYKDWRIRCVHVGATTSITYNCYSSVLT